MTEARHRGFTLLEAIIAIVITGIVAGMISSFMVLPIHAYLDSMRRAGMTDTADTALRRIAFELRGTVPNSLRVDASQQFLEYVPASDGGRYRSQLSSAGTEDILDSTSDTDTLFDVMGPEVSGAAGDHVVIFNTGQVGLDIYVGLNRRVLAGAAGAQVSFTHILTTPFPPFESPNQRFQIVPASGPVSFACEGMATVNGNGQGTLKRYTGYGFNGTQPTSGLGTGTLLADNLSDCRFDYAAISASNGLLILQLSITRDSESVTLHHQVHVDNTP